MPFSMGDAELRTLFSQHGEVMSANVITDRDSGRSRGFGFVEMSDDDATAAMDALNETEVEGRKIIVNKAKPRREGGGRGGGGGGGYNRY
jgi:RNA recognition motif-containing protein